MQMQHESTPCDGYDEMLQQTYQNQPSLLQCHPRLSKCITLHLQTKNQLLHTRTRLMLQPFRDCCTESILPYRRMRNADLAAQTPSTTNTAKPARCCLAWCSALLTCAVASTHPKELTLAHLLQPDVCTASVALHLLVCLCCKLYRKSPLCILPVLRAHAVHIRCYTRQLQPRRQCGAPPTCCPHATRQACSVPSTAAPWWLSCCCCCLTCTQQPL